MNDEQKKGVILIVGGILFTILFPALMNIFGFYYSGFGILGNLVKIIGLVIVGMGIKVLVSEKNATDEEELIIPESQPLGLSPSNRVVKITLTGGIIGLLAGNPINTLNKKIRIENAKGWEVVQVLPDTSLNLLTLILRMILLAITFLLYTTSNGYYIVLKYIPVIVDTNQVKPVLAANPVSKDVYAELEKLAELKAKGVISEEEFNKSKNDILSNS